MRVKKTLATLLEEISILLYKMASFENITIGELKMLGKTRSIDEYENMSMQQKESVFTTPSITYPAPEPKPTLAPKPTPLSKNTWYEWYDWLISYIPKSVKKSVSHVEENIMTLSLKDYSPKHTAEWMNISRLNLFETAIHFAHSNDYAKCKMVTIRPGNP